MPSMPPLGYGLVLAPPAAPPVGVQTFAGDCTTPKTVFNIQDSDKDVCAKVTGGLTYWRLIWSNSRFLAVQNNPITSSTQEIKFTLSPSSSVGDWRAILYDPIGGSVQSVASFTVIDAANPVADISVSNGAVTQSVSAGSQVIFALQVTNFGPSNAVNVQLTESGPSNASFLSFTQLSGPIFTCNSPSVGGSGPTTCTVASLGQGDTATFLATYEVDGGVSAGQEIADSASITSDTADDNERNNTSGASAKALASPCVIDCPANITVGADAGQAGAVVAYATPTSTGGCGDTTGLDENGNPIPDISCSNPSGSFFPVGTTNVFCTAPNGSACTFLVTVENPGGLSISLNGANPLAVECGEDFNDPGASAVDASGQSVPVAVTLPPGFNPDAPASGSHTITYTATQGVNSVSTTRTVNVADTTAPKITIAGANPYKIEVGSCRPFVDPGVSATDSCAGPVAVTNSISGPGGLTSVNPNTAGTYTVTYTASDGSHQATATRTVLVGNFPPDEVEDPGTPTTPPVITLLGGDPDTHVIVMECGSTFNDPGASATNACGGTIAYTTSGTLNTHTPGTYEVNYTATDGALSTTVTRTVTVQDTAAPIITVNGANPMTVECHTDFVDPGATAHDACAGDFAATASGSVIANTVGTYTITYTATDPSGHAGASVTRTVNVVDTTAPVITLNGANPFTVECHTSFNDPGATATDACDSTTPVSVSGSVNVNVPGTYTLTYTAPDDYGNSAPKTRTVLVKDTIPPVITVNSLAPSLWPANHKYVSFNVTDFVTGVSDSCNTSLGVSSVVVEKITSDETENGNGDGNTTNDMVIAADCKSFQVRAERDGGGDGRVYIVTFAVKDSATGNVGRKTVKLVVPHNNGQTPVDSGVHYTVNGSCP